MKKDVYKEKLLSFIDRVLAISKIYISSGDKMEKIVVAAKALKENIEKEDKDKLKQKKGEKK